MNKERERERERKKANKKAVLPSLISTGKQNEFIESFFVFDML